MKAKEVLETLGITRPTLTKYVKTGLIGVTILPNGRYSYNEEDVRKFLNDCDNKSVCIFDDGSHLEEIRAYCYARGYSIKWEMNNIFDLLDELVVGHIGRIVAFSPNQIESLSIFERICKIVHCELEFLNEVIA